MSISIDALRSYVEKIAKKVLNDESSKPVISGTIKSSLPGIYEVQLVNGNETSLIRAESLYADKTFAVDDYVYLVRAENNRGDEYETKYFIVGLVTTVEQNFANLTEWERFLGDGQKINPTFDTKITDANFINAIRANGVFSFSAKVTTNITEQTDFGFKFTFTFDDDTTKEEPFPGITFVGQPWSLNKVAQKKIFDLGTQNTLKSITITKVEPNNGTFDATDISLESGTFLDLAQDFKVTLENVNGKNYFNKSTDDRVVQIKANVNYGNQKLDTKALKYYWFVKKDNAIKINSLGGNDWECLNDFSCAKIIDGSGITERPDVLIYKTDDNILEIAYDDANTKNWLPHYENEIKCVVGYQLANATSEPIKIYNFNHESYEVTIEKISGENPILYANETITLTAKVSSKTVGGKFSFEWYNKNGKLKYDIPPVKDENDKIITPASEGDYVDNTLIISGDSAKKSKSDLYVMAAANETFYCRLIVNGNDFGKSNEYTVVSRAGETQVLEDTFNYKYWINEANNIRFISEEKEETVYAPNSNGIVEEFKDKDKYLEYKTESGDFGTDAVNLEWLNGTGPFANKGKDKSYYLYYSEQKIVVDKDRVDEQGNKFPVRFDDYSKPKILRQVFINSDENITDMQSTGSIEKLNTFNDLTDGGRTQGIKYKDATYSKTTVFDENKLNTGKGYYKENKIYKYTYIGTLTSFEQGIEYYYSEDSGVSYIKETKETPVEKREYYKKELDGADYILRPQDEDNYNFDINGNLAGFKSNEEYYEQNGGDLYINASFIRSGHLEVSDGEKTVFFADFDSGIVQIGTGSVSGLDDNLSLLNTNILNAQTTAETAQSAANSAQTAANNAQNTANSALTNFTSTFIVTDNIIYANAGKTLYLGSGGGQGDLIINTGALKFNINNNKKLEIIGDVTATSGSIGGFHIVGNHLANGDTDTPTVGEHTVLLSGSGVVGSGNNPFEDGEFVFWAGAGNTGDSKPFWVKKTGAIKATSGTIGGFELDDNSIKSKNNNIQLDSNTGNAIFSGSTTFSGNLTVSGTGKIANFNFNSSRLYSDDQNVLISPNYNNYVFWAGEAINGDDSTRPFLIDKYGTVNATRLTIRSSDRNSSFSVNSDKLIFNHSNKGEYFELSPTTLAFFGESGEHADSRRFFGITIGEKGSQNYIHSTTQDLYFTYSSGTGTALSKMNLYANAISAAEIILGDGGSSTITDSKTIVLGGSVTLKATKTNGIITNVWLE